MSYHMMNYHNLDHMSCLMFLLFSNTVPHVLSHVVPHGLPHAVCYLKLIYSHGRIHKGNINFNFTKYTSSEFNLVFVLPWMLPYDLTTPQKEDGPRTGSSGK